MIFLALPLLLITGLRDETVRPDNSRKLAARIRGLGGRAETRFYRHVNHTLVVGAQTRSSPLQPAILQRSLRPETVPLPPTRTAPPRLLTFVAIAMASGLLQSASEDRPPLGSATPSQAGTPGAFQQPLLPTEEREGFARMVVVRQWAALTAHLLVPPSHASSGWWAQ